jgi:hypothetical protein
VIKKKFYTEVISKKIAKNFVSTIILQVDFKIPTIVKLTSQFALTTTSASRHAQKDQPLVDNWSLAIHFPFSFCWM